MGKHVRVRTSEPPLAASNGHPGEGVALPRTPRTPHSNARDGRRKGHKSGITDLQALSLLERRGGKTEHYTTGVQYELKTSLQVRPPPSVATGTSPRAPRNRTTAGYISEIPYKPPGGYISPYKSPTRLDELGKLSREIPAPWDYAEAQIEKLAWQGALNIFKRPVEKLNFRIESFHHFLDTIKAAPPPPGASMFSKSTENFSEDKWYRRTIFNAPELVDTTLKYPGPGAYDPVLNASSRSRRSPMKRWNVKEPGVGSIFEVDDSGSFCMVQWAPPYPAAEDEFTICPTGQNGEYWLATFRSPPPTPPAKRWQLDALVSPRYQYNVALGTYCIEHKHKQAKVKEKSRRRGVRDYVLGSIIQEVKLMVLEEARARDQLEYEKKRRELLLQKSQAADDSRKIAIPGKGIWKTAADLENLREGAKSQPFAWLFKDVINGIKRTDTGHDRDFQKQIQDQLRNADLSLVTTFNALPLGDEHGPGTGKTQKEIKQFFDDADANGSGTICATELKGLITACRDGQEPTDDDIVKALTHLDKDSNGTIDFAEFLILIEPFLRKKSDKSDVEKPIADDLPFTEAEMKLGNLERVSDAHKMLEEAQPSKLKIHAARTNEGRTVRPPPMLCRSDSCTLIEGSALKQTKMMQIQSTDEDSINLLRHQDPAAVKALRKASRSVLIKDNVHDTVFRHKKKHIPKPSPRQLRALADLAKPRTLEDPTERPRARHLPRSIFNDTSRARFESSNRLVQHQQQAQVHESQIHIFHEDAEGGSGDEINDGESGNENDLAHDHGSAPHEYQEVCDGNGSEGQGGVVMERSEGFAVDEAMAWEEDLTVSMPGGQDGRRVCGDGEGQTEGGYQAQESGQVEECARSEAKGGGLSHLQFADEIAALRVNRTRSISIAEIGNSMDWPEAEQRRNREAEEAAHNREGGEDGECREQKQKQRELVSRQSQGRARTGGSSPQDLRRTETPVSASKTPPATTTPLNSQDAQQQAIAAVAVSPQREDELVISSNVDSGEPDTIE